MSFKQNIYFPKKEIRNWSFTTLVLISVLGILFFSSFKQEKNIDKSFKISTLSDKTTLAIISFSDEEKDESSIENFDADTFLIFNALEYHFLPILISIGFGAFISLLASLFKGKFSNYLKMSHISLLSHKREIYLYQHQLRH